jgi:kynurenine formamidase
MADNGVKVFGLETISPDLIYLYYHRGMTEDFLPAHKAGTERGLSHYECLNNLKQVVNCRFQFYGFPLRLEPAAGSPVRAVAALNDESST